MADALHVDEVVKTYRTGGCFAMAEALHRLTGWPVRCIDFATCVHAFVLSPDNEVLDIHGLTPWPAFLDFLAAEAVLPKEAVAAGRVVHQDVTAAAESGKWRYWGYKPPSETAIRKAMAVARRHPNVKDALPPQGRARKASPGF